MDAFFEACLVFPVVIFSFLLGLVMIYWLFVMLGALDMDVLDIDIDVDVDADVDVDVDVDADAGSGRLFADLLQRFDLTEVPLTASISVFALIAWFLSFLAVHLTGPVATSLVWGSAIAISAMFAALLITSRAGHLLKPLFRTHYAPTNRSFIGRECEITTLRVDDTYGQAEVVDGGAGLLIQVRSSGADQLQRGSRALIFEYDREREIFHVKSLDQAEPEFAT